ncbi:1250_t:CDS:2 [Funneliformis mosseae]|uniref:1250_t:CDS:1 n=1 Tax=Funneliformis mosseae TaxID=27381 RepID=A0A9N8VQC3_FUNMO|nr:1250_t:CDS:2 [Funneliformis mosseae]
MSSFNITNFTSTTNDFQPKFTYKKRKANDNKIEVIQNDEMLEGNQQNEPMLDIGKDASSDLKLQENTEKKNQGVPSPFILGHIISENELALATSYRKLNDVFDEFSELQQQNNKVSKNTDFKKFERDSDIGKRNQNSFATEESKNNRRRNNKKRGGGGGRKQKEIAERALKSKSVNRGLLGKRVIVEEFHDNEIANQKDIDSEQSNDSSEVEDWHDMLPILTSTPDNSTLVLQKMGEFVNRVDSEASTNNEFHNDTSEELDVQENLEILDPTTPLALQREPKDQISIPPPKKDVIRRFILKPLSDDDDELF